ncbi:rRNA maturation RNase YbeY [Candidatus Binatia bacterium]|nr:rRNA maturation RNase YbeY [Candidatus Binatia bacterium]
MPVSVHRRCGSAAIAAAVRADTRRLVRLLGEAEAELTVSLVGDAAIRALNREYRHADRPTDVLAFAMREGERVAGDDPVLGDVVISLETAARQAQRRRVSLARELRTLLVHGVLHLLGYDHERSAAEARRMRAAERRTMAALEASQSLAPPRRGRKNTAREES